MSTKFFAQKYINEGWSPIPIPRGEKGPRISGWEHQDFTPADFADDDNIGVHLAKHTNGPGLYDVDLDDKLAAVAADILLAPTNRIHGRPGKPRSHRWYTCDDVINHYVMHGLGGNNDTLVELRGISPSTGSHTQTMVPPSKHPSGEFLAWDADQKPGHFKDAATFIEQVKHVGLACLIARGFPGAGNRHGPRMALAGFLFRAGLDELVIKAIGRAVMKMIGGDEQDWLDTCRTTLDKLKADPDATVTGGPALAEAMGADGPAIIKKCNQYLGRLDQAMIDEVIQNYNKKYFMVMAGATAVVADDSDSGGNIRLLTHENFKKMLMKERMPARKGKDTIDKKTGKVTPGKMREGKPCAEVWLEHKDGRHYDNLVYAPPPLECSKDDYNGWRGFSVAPVEGEFPLIERHIRDIFCGGDDDAYAWFMNWAAALMQRPGLHANTGIVAQGGQGVGKGLVFHDLLGKMFDQRHYITISSSEQFYGRFAGELLSGKCLVFLDEATWGGNKRDLGTLKDRVTGDFITIDRKGISQVKERSMLHLVIASNEDWPIAVDSDDRRFTVFRVDNPFANNPDYFDPLYFEIEHGGRQALLHVLMNIPIDEQMLRKPYETAAKTKLKEESLSPTAEWWRECLMNERIASEKRWPASLTYEGITSAYQTWMGNTGQHRKLSQNKLVAKITEMCPGVSTFRPHGQQRSLKFPGLDLCRMAFDQWLKSETVWGEPVQTTLSDSEDTDVPF